VKYTLILLILSLCAVSCTHHEKEQIAPTSLTEVAINFNFEDAKIQSRNLYGNAEWYDSTWMSQTLILDPKARNKNEPPASWSYRVTGHNSGVLIYDLPAYKGSSHLRYEFDMKFNSADIGIAQGKGSDYEWSMRFIDIPFALIRTTNDPAMQSRLYASPTEMMSPLAK